MNKFSIYLLLALAGSISACSTNRTIKIADGNAFPNRTQLGKIALRESAIPIHPGKPGSVPFWNEAAVSFIYAPAFDFNPLAGATSYQYKVTSAEGGKQYSFISQFPYEALSPIWTAVPVGNFTLQVVGLSAKGDSIGLAGQGEYHRAAPFNGPYHQPVMPYDQSAIIALENLIKKDYVQYWLINKIPDPNYKNYAYPAKIYSALVIGAITYAKFKPNTPESAKATELAKTVADFMLRIRYEKGAAWEYFVPTYYGKQYMKVEQVDLANNFTIMGADAGNAFLDLYDHTGDEKYLQAAKQIAATYLKNQMDNGSWYQFVNYATNKPVAPNIAIPTAIMTYFERLTKQYNVEGLELATKKAFEYVMNNPVKTFNWQAQFEDVKANLPYKNLSREQACDFASYLMQKYRNNKSYINIAKDLIRFAEDQFVIWEKPRNKKPQHNGPGWIAANWITPSVQEQYVYWNPVGRSASVMMQTYMDAYHATGDIMYLEKAKSIANALTLVQKEHNGDYPTFFTKYTMPLWLNSTVYPAKVMMNLARIVR